MILRLSAALSILILSGCSFLNANVLDEWKCPAQFGRLCVTIDEADTLSGNNTGSPGGAPASPVVEEAVLLPQTGDDAQEEIASPPLTVDGPPAPAIRVRRPEILARVWFYPFVDETNHYHEGAFVHVVMRPADWQTG
ncbi:MAG: TraV family lipoprotein, partial [bacterium]|nr:TraV family lipoprotein [bacterium]